MRDTWLSISSVLGACVLTQIFKVPPALPCWPWMDSSGRGSELRRCCAQRVQPPPANVDVHSAAFKEADDHFDIVMWICAASLVISTAFYCIADPSPG